MDGKQPSSRESRGRKFSSRQWMNTQSWKINDASLIYVALMEMVGIINNYFQFKNTYKRNFMVMAEDFIMKLVWFRVDGVCVFVDVISSFIYFCHDYKPPYTYSTRRLMLDKILLISLLFCFVIRGVVREKMRCKPELIFILNR